ncbi:MAG: type II 3-dehydroquinate dehydratase [Chloroflexota bacterium]|nr:type II 3-dehydroquinate dehydratase [Chloroflexota bacterium]MDE2682603.1 type II 3-dehydroquinate dehydratase [Chloroflexota bacterium]
MTTILVLHGPNLNALGRRDRHHYGTLTLDEINRRIEERAASLGVEAECFQSNHEGALIDRLQDSAGRIDGVVINAGALTHYGLSLKDALTDTGVPVVEVHLSNIHAREAWRRHSVLADTARGQIAGLGWRGYTAALEALAGIIVDEAAE